MTHLEQLTEQLNEFPAWKLHKYTQAWEQGRISDDIFECSILCDTKDGGEWITGYAGNLEVSIERALECFVPAEEREVLKRLKERKIVFEGLGDHKKIPSKAKQDLYDSYCVLMGFEPKTKPFAWVNFEGKATLVATNDCYYQLMEKKRLQISQNPLDIEKGI